ncbi:MAG: hydantoinase B/oxoprolinase family protein, partial [Gammaproteobacteria bacterium]
YMIMQGSGGGYGDVLDRDPDLVIRDIEEGLLSHEAAQRVYKLVYNPETLVLDREGTQKARQAEREARKKRGVPFKEFVKKWNQPEPPADLPYYGAWGADRETIYAGPYGGVPRATMSASNIQPIYMPNPRDVKIAQLEARIKELEGAKKG